MGYLVVYACDDGGGGDGGTTGVNSSLARQLKQIVPVLAKKKKDVQVCVDGVERGKGGRKIRPCRVPKSEEEEEEDEGDGYSKRERESGSGRRMMRLCLDDSRLGSITSSSLSYRHEGGGDDDVIIIIYVYLHSSPPLCLSLSLPPIPLPSLSLLSPISSSSLVIKVVLN